jgi:hypothetical protein
MGTRFGLDVWPVAECHRLSVMSLRLLMKEGSPMPYRRGYFRCAAVTLLVLLCYGAAPLPRSGLTGQARVLSDTTNTQDTSDDIRLADGPVARLDLPNQQNPIRTIEVYPTESNSRVQFYHTPLLALIENPSPIAGYPKAVWAATQDSFDPDIKRLTFVVRLTTPELQATLAQLLLNLNLINSIASVVMRPWPIHEISVQLIDPNTGKNKQSFGQSDTQPVVGRQGSPITISIPVHSSDLPRFLSESTGIINAPELVWSYAFQDVQLKYASNMAKSSAAVNQVITNALAAQQKRPNDPIFQDQAQTIRQQLSNSIQQTIVTNSPDLIPVVSIDITTILKPDLIDLTKTINTNDQAALTGYLQPLLQKYQTSTEQREQNTHTHEHDTKVSLSPSLNIGGIGASFSIGDEEKDQLQNENGVTLKQSTDGQSFLPYQISVYRVAEGYQDSTTSIVRQAFVAAGFSDVTTPQGALPMTFSESAALASPASSVPFAGIQLGMGFCYFGDKAPPGFVFADGSAYWPDEDWVPATLRHTRMVNMEDTVIAATNNPALAGTIAPGGSIPSQTGSATITANPSLSTEVFGLRGVPYNWRNGDLSTSVIDVRAANETIQVPMTNVYVPTQTSGGGPVSMPPISLDGPDRLPRRVLCRWLIRVQ